MKIHITCTEPTRSLVIAMHAAREILTRAGHLVTVGLPERLESASGPVRIGLAQPSLEGADAVVHAHGPDEALPSEVRAAANAGKTVVLYCPRGGARVADSPVASCAVTCVEELPAALAEACAFAVA